MYDAVYARQSHFKRDSISIDTQVEMAERVCTNPVKYYKDPGYSGKNTKRPAYQQLMKDMEKGLIQKVVVYKIDRFSRSLLDFAAAWENLHRHNVDFVSVTENFDTSTAMGKAMLYMAAIFAELEREQISARVTDNYYARVKEGWWPGGPAPYGFDLCKAMPGGKKTMLTPNGQMEVVKRIFQLYGMPLVSLGEIANMLNEEGVAGPGGRKAIWQGMAVHRLISNPCYVKSDISIYSFYKNKGVAIDTDGEHNGIESYNGERAGLLIGKTAAGKDGSVKGTLANGKNLDSMKFILARWPGIIEPSLFLRCQDKLLRNRQIGKLGEGAYTWLSGLLKCSRCNRALRVAPWINANKEKILNLSCSGRANHICEVNSFPFKADDIERDVQKELEKLLGSCETVREEQEENSEIKIALYKVDEEIRNLISVLKSEIAAGPMLKYVNEEITGMEKHRKELLNRQESKKVSVQLEPIIFGELSFEDKKRVAHTFIEKVLVDPDEKLIIQWRN